jgi:hypothetical protein
MSRLLISVFLIGSLLSGALAQSPTNATIAVTSAPNTTAIVPKTTTTAATTSTPTTAAPSTVIPSTAPPIPATTQQPTTTTSPTTHNATTAPTVTPTPLATTASPTATPTPTPQATTPAPTTATTPPFINYTSIDPVVAASPQVIVTFRAFVANSEDFTANALTPSILSNAIAAALALNPARISKLRVSTNPFDIAALKRRMAMKAVSTIFYSTTAIYVEFTILQSSSTSQSAGVIAQQFQLAVTTSDSTLVATLGVAMQLQFDQAFVITVQPTGTELMTVPSSPMASTAGKSLVVILSFVVLVFVLIFVTQWRRTKRKAPAGTKELGFLAQHLGFAQRQNSRQNSLLGIANQAGFADTHMRSNSVPRSASDYQMHRRY